MSNTTKRILFLLGVFSALMLVLPLVLLTAASVVGVGEHDVVRFLCFTGGGFLAVVTIIAIAIEG